MLDVCVVLGHAGSSRARDALLSCPPPWLIDEGPERGALLYKLIINESIIWLRIILRAKNGIQQEKAGK